MKGFPMVPIGYVESTIRKTAHPDSFTDTVCSIRVLPLYEEALYGIEQRERIVVVFCFHLSLGFTWKIHPRGDITRPLTGLFSTCSPFRPNRIGVSSVSLLAREAAVLTVKGLDAIDGTPVLDIKPDIRFTDGLSRPEPGP